MIKQFIKKYNIYIRIAFSILIIVLIISHPKVDFKNIIIIVSKLDIIYLLPLLILRLLGILLLSLRLKFVLSIKNLNYNPFKLIKLYFLGKFYNQFLPSGYGGDIVRGYLLSRNQTKKIQAFSAVFVDRLIGLGSQLTICFIVAVFGYKYIEFLGNSSYIFIVLPVTFFVFLYLFSIRSFVENFGFILNLLKFRGLNEKIKEFYYTLISFKDNAKMLIISFINSLFIQFLFYVGYYFLSLSLNMDVNVRYFFIFTPIIFIIAIIPLSISGIGIRESGFIFFFTMVGASANEAFSLSILILTLLLIEGLIGGIINLLGKYEFRNSR